MVFHSVSEPETPRLAKSMASTVSFKSQALHNLPLPGNLKWVTNHTNTHRLRRQQLAESTHSPPRRNSELYSFSPFIESDSETRRRNPVRDSVRTGFSLSDSDRLVKKVKCDSDSEYRRRNPVCDGVETGVCVYDSEHLIVKAEKSSGAENRKRSKCDMVFDGVKNGVSAFGSDRFVEKSVKKLTVSDLLVDNSEKKSTASGGRSKILLRFHTKGKSDDTAADASNQNSISAYTGEEWVPKPKKNSDDVAEESAPKEKNKSDDETDAGDQSTMAEDAEESSPKTWNLRPRKAVIKKPNANGGAPKIGGALVQETKPQMLSRPELTRSCNLTNVKDAQKEEKRKFSLSLLKEEIEKDIFAMTGSKPARRPSKRPRNVQNKLDGLLPGLWLGSITPETYQVPDTPAKR